jgi:hypothetical protein
MESVDPVGIGAGLEICSTSAGYGEPAATVLGFIVTLL